MKEINAEEFREQYAKSRGYRHFPAMIYASYDPINDLMNAYAIRVLERVEKEAEELSGHVTYPDGSTEIYISSDNLKQIFEEIKKELKS